MMLPGDVDVRAALAVWRYNITRNRRDWKHHIVPQMLQPFVYLLGMGFGVGAFVSTGTGGGYLGYVAPGLLVWAVVQGVSMEATFSMFVKLVHQKLFAAFLSTPCQPQDIALGELLWAVTRGLIYGGFFLLVLLGFTLAWTPVLDGATVLAIPLAMLLVGTVFALIGQLITCLIRNMNLYNYYFQLVLTPLFLVSGIFFPVERFPTLAWIVWFTPLYHGVRLVRGLAHGQFARAELISTIWLVVVAVVLFWLVQRVMRRRLYS